jgi:hypothetical protein
MPRGHSCGRIIDIRHAVDPRVHIGAVEFWKPIASLKTAWNESQSRMRVASIRTIICIPSPGWSRIVPALLRQLLDPTVASLQQLCAPVELFDLVRAH